MIAVADPMPALLHAALIALALLLWAMREEEGAW